MSTAVNDDNVRQRPTAINTQHAESPPSRGDWPGVIKFALVAAVMVASLLSTGTAESAVLVASPLVALLRR